LLIRLFTLPLLFCLALNEKEAEQWLLTSIYKEAYEALKLLKAELKKGGKKDYKSCNDNLRACLHDSSELMSCLKNATFATLYGTAVDFFQNEQPKLRYESHQPEC
jgi:hypothetical protein